MGEIKSCLLKWSGLLLTMAGIGWGAVNIQGTVTDSVNGQAIAGASVRLAKLGHQATTGTDGRFQLTGSATGIIAQTQRDSRLFSMRIGPANNLVLDIRFSQSVRVSIVTMQGQTITQLHNGALEPGSTIFNSPALVPGYYLLLLETAGNRHTTPLLVDGSGKWSGLKEARVETSTPALHRVGSASSFADTVIVSKTGYIQKRIPVSDSVISNLAIKLRASTVGAPEGMVLISAKNKTFKMGAKPGEGYDDEYPQQDVTFTYDFYMGETPVTQAEYREIMGVNPSSTKNDNAPVNNISWYDAILFCNAKSKREGKDTVYTYTGGKTTPSNHAYGSAPAKFDPAQLTGLQIRYERSGYRLPTEAEFEFAARGGNTDKYFFGGGNGPTYPTGALLASVNEYAWHSGNCSSLQPVKRKKPNPYGLYDIYGGVWEWCNDWARVQNGAQIGYTSASAGTDPKGEPNPSTDTQLGPFRVFRGGDWSYGSNACNSTFRSGKGSPDFRFICPGLRFVLRVQ